MFISEKDNSSWEVRKPKLRKASKFEWMLDNIRIEKIISATISVPKFILGRFQLC